MNGRPDPGDIVGRNASRPRGSLSISEPRELLVMSQVRGAYRADGVDRDTLRLRGMRAEPSDRVPERLPPQTPVSTFDQEVVWGGCGVGHFGHFMTETVSRLWPLLPGGPLEGLPVVFTTLQQPSAKEWMQAFGVTVVELPRSRAVRFTRMRVPQPACRLGAWIAPELRDVHLHARRGLNVDAPRRAGVLWLSRSRLDPDRRAYDEHLLEWILGKHVAVVHPQDLTLAEQLAAIESCDTVTGIAGSAFHALLMASSPPEAVFLRSANNPWAFEAQDSVMGAESTYVRSLAYLAAQTQRRPPASHRVLIPETLRTMQSTALPALFEDRRAVTLAFPERHLMRLGNRFPDDTLESRAVAVIVDPLAIGPRMDLAGMFEAEGLLTCAAEQYMTVSDLRSDYAYGPLRAARCLAALGRHGEASAMAERALAIDPSSREARTYVTATRTS